MKNFISLSIGIAVSLQLAQANNLPADPSMEEYKSLLQRALFAEAKRMPVTKKVETPPANSSLQLRGVAKFKEGWFITLVDRKKPKESFFLAEGKSQNEKGLRLVKVNQNKNDYMKTTVELMDNGREITVGYDQKDLKSRIARATKSQQPVITPKKQSTAKSRRPRVKTPKPQKPQNNQKPR